MPSTGVPTVTVDMVALADRDEHFFEALDPGNESSASLTNQVRDLTHIVADLSQIVASQSQELARLKAELEMFSPAYKHATRSGSDQSPRQSDGGNTADDLERAQPVRGVTEDVIRNVTAVGTGAIASLATTTDAAITSMAMIGGAVEDPMEDLPDYELGGTMWEAPLVLGSALRGWGNAAVTIVLLVINAALQIFVIYVINKSMLDLPVTDADIDGYLLWRRTQEHDYKHMNKLAQKSLARMTCDNSKVRAGPRVAPSVQHPTRLPTSPVPAPHPARVDSSSSRALARRRFTSS